MIIENYSVFRAIANPGGALAADGLTEFDPANMRAGGFSGGISVSSTSAFPIVFSCNSGAADSVAGIDQFDWYVSQQTSVVANKPFTVSRKDTAPNTHSGRIEIDLSAWASTEYPDPFDLSAIQVLYFAVDIYVIRRSDAAIQRLDLRTYLYDALKPKTNIGT
jgi:hypothetical protein